MTSFSEFLTVGCLRRDGGGRPNDSDISSSSSEAESIDEFDRESSEHPRSSLISETSIMMALRPISVPSRARLTVESFLREAATGFFGKKDLSWGLDGGVAWDLYEGEWPSELLSFSRLAEMSCLVLSIILLTCRSTWPPS